MKGFLYGQTGYNLLENSIKLDEYIKMAKENHFDFLSLTDKNLSISFRFYNECKKNNIKPIIGLEYTFINDDYKESKVLLYAKNKNGLKKLFKISSDVSINLINDISNILGLKDILYVYIFEDSYIYRLYQNSDFYVLLDYLNKIDNESTYFAYSYTNDSSKIQITGSYLEYLNNYGFKTIEVHNTKYLLKEDAIVYKSLLNTTGKDYKIDNQKDYSFLINPTPSKEIDDFISLIDDELFEHVKKTIPKFVNKKGMESTEYLKNLCYKGLMKRNRFDEIHKKRLDYELDIIIKMGYQDYFLIVWDFIRYSKTNDILVGPGRGSGASSLAAYTLGITEIDPLDYNLLFERFLNPERVSMPDIDTDFPDDKRDLVIDYVKNLYGEDHVCNITAFGTWQLKSSVRELSKCFNIELSRAEAIVDMVRQKGYDTLLQEYKDTNLYNFLYVAKRIEDLPKHITTHAAGIIISDDSLYDIIPLQNGINGLKQSQFEFVDLEALGLLKMDFLGIRNLTFLKEMMDMTPGFDMKALRNINLNDKNIFSIFQRGDTLGIFQFESLGIRRVLRDIKPDCFTDLVAINALYRPGPMESIPEYSARKKGKKYTYLHKDLEPILAQTYGIIVYQEQVMQIAQKFAGFTLGEADILRKAISKKNADVLAKVENEFIEKSVLMGHDRALAIQIYDLIYKFANYGFNKAHAVVYSYLAYQMAYFKVYHFDAFVACILNNTLGNAKSQIDYMNYAKTRNIRFMKPNINISTDKYILKDGIIYMPFLAINTIGIMQTKQILEERNKNGIFTSYENFKKRLDLSSSAMEALIFGGAFDVFNKSKKNLMNSLTKKDDIFFKHMENVKEDNSEFDFPYLAQMELKYLNYNFEYSIYKNINLICQKEHALRINNLRIGNPSSIIASLNNIKKIRTKNSEDMAILDLSDGDNILRGVIFPKVYVKFYNILTQNKLYKVFGRLNNDNEGMSFIILSISEIN